MGGLNLEGSELGGGGLNREGSELGWSESGEL